MALLNECHLCRQTADPRSSVNIFSSRSLSLNWPARISTLLKVAVEYDKSLPPPVCSMCIRRVQSIEKALVDLKNFEQLANSSLRSLIARGPVKRTRVTGGDLGVSPSTARARPSAKMSRKQLFPRKYATS